MVFPFKYTSHLSLLSRLGCLRVGFRKKLQKSANVKKEKKVNKGMKISSM